MTTPDPAVPVDLRPLGVGEILDVALKIVWRNAGTLLRVVVFVILPVQIVEAIVEVSAAPDSLNRNGGVFVRNENGTVSVHDVHAAFAGFGIVALLGVLASTLVSGACYRVIASAYLGRQTGWKESLRFALRHLHSLLWVTILGGVIAVIGFVLCVIPGVYLWVSFGVAVPVLLTEGRRGRKALGRSRSLVKGYWWRVFGVLFLGFLLVGILSSAIGAVVLGVSTVQPGDSTVAGVLVSVVAGTVSRLLTTPLVAAFVVVIYFDLRVRKEGFDLQLLADRIGVDPPEGGLPSAPPPGSDDLVPDPNQPPFWPPPPGWKPGGGSP